MSSVSSVSLLAGRLAQSASLAGRLGSFLPGRAGLALNAGRYGDHVKVTVAMDPLPLGTTGLKRPEPVDAVADGADGWIRSKSRRMCRSCSRTALVPSEVSPYGGAERRREKEHGKETAPERSGQETHRRGRLIQR
ncbi:MAG: hypothetical protein HYV04_19555 [Deltaproteobacteria bacterium]|nr:hypothetical protein [Deltaproteobacteria bacterium]